MRAFSNPGPMVELSHILPMSYHITMDNGKDNVDTDDNYQMTMKRIIKIQYDNKSGIIMMIITKRYDNDYKYL